MTSRLARLAALLPLAVAALPLAHAGITGNSYAVTGITNHREYGLQTLEGCIDFGSDATMRLVMESEALLITQTITPYSEVDFLLFGFWSLGGTQPAVAGVHLWFGQVLIAGPNQFYASGSLADCAMSAREPAAETSPEAALARPAIRSTVRRSRAELVCAR